jgi:hypothetical protein
MAKQRRKRGKGTDVGRIEAGPLFEDGGVVLRDEVGTAG